MQKWAYPLSLLLTLGIVVLGASFTVGFLVSSSEGFAVLAGSWVVLYLFMFYLLKKKVKIAWFLTAAFSLGTIVTSLSDTWIANPLFILLEIYPFVHIAALVVSYRQLFPSSKTPTKK